MEDCLKHLNRIMNSCRLYFFDNGLDISPTKSAVTVFTRHRLQYEDTINLGGFNISWRPSFRYLGIYLDQKLTWEEHINYIISKGEKSLNILKATTKRHWGADPKVALSFYRAYTRSIIDFGSIFYGSATKTRLTKVDRLQFKALRIITGAFRSTPTLSLLAMCGELPLNLRRLQLAQKFLIKNLFVNNKTLINKIREISISNLTEKYWEHKNSPPITDAFTETSQFDKRVTKCDNLPFFVASFESFLLDIEIIMPEYSNTMRYNENVVKEILSDFPDICTVFTDGSKTGQGVGCAFYVPSDNYAGMFKCESDTSIFTAEGYAVYKALEYILQEPRFPHYAILTDSLSVLQAILNKHKNLYKNLLVMNISQKLLELENNNTRISFIWVKGHAGIKENERVDSLAKQAITEGVPISGLQHYDAISVSQNNIWENWKLSYKQCARESSSPYAKIIEHVTKKPMMYEITLNRHQYVSINRAIFGHGNFGYLLHKMKITDTPLCKCNNQSVDNLEHWLFDCRFNQDATDYLLDQLAKQQLLPINIASLMSLVLENSNLRNIFIKFLKICRRRL